LIEYKVFFYSFHSPKKTIMESKVSFVCLFSFNVSWWGCRI
jgi:hypothetical protein